MINRYLLIICVLFLGCKGNDKLKLASVVSLIEQDSVVLFGDVFNLIANDQFIYAKDFSSEDIYSIALENGNVTNSVVKNIPWDSIYNHFKTKYKNQIDFKYAEFDDNQRIFTEGLTCKDVTTLQMSNDTMIAGAYITIATDSMITSSSSGSGFNDTYLLSIPFIVRYMIKGSHLNFLDIVDFDFPINRLNRINLYSFLFFGNKMITLSNSKDEVLFEFNKAHNSMSFYTQLKPTSLSYNDDNYFIPLIKDDIAGNFAFGNMVFDKDLNVKIDLTSELKQLKILQGHIAALHFTETRNVIIYVDHSLENNYYCLYRTAGEEKWEIIQYIKINPMSCVFKGNNLYSILPKKEKYELNIYEVN